MEEDHLKIGTVAFGQPAAAPAIAEGDAARHFRKHSAVDDTLAATGGTDMGAVMSMILGHLLIDVPE